MRMADHSSPSGRRWLIFYTVGAMGIAVQMCVLMMLTAWIGLNYLAATALSVEGAILHNFFWHDRWTWADRSQTFRDPFFRRLSCFHLTNGVISLAANIILTRVLVERFSLSYIPANALAIALCSVANYLVGDRIVFRSGRKNPKTKRLVLSTRRFQVSLGVFLTFAMVPLSGAAALECAELRPETLKAWQKYVETAERRMERELVSPKGFLILDFQRAQEAARAEGIIFGGNTRQADGNV